MLPWMLGGLAIIGFFAWKVIHDAEEYDRQTKLAKKKK